MHTVNTPEILVLSYRTKRRHILEEIYVVTAVTTESRDDIRYVLDTKPKYDLIISFRNSLQ
jgi:hypothetical protein